MNRNRREPSERGDAPEQVGKWPWTSDHPCYYGHYVRDGETICQRCEANLTRLENTDGD